MVQLPEVSSDAGVLSRLIISECENPGFPDYDESDGRLSFRLMQAVITNRLSNNPGQFGAPNATDFADIITAPGQFQGFTSSGGVVHLSQSVSDRIDAVMTNANAGSPGPYLQFVEDILNQVSAAVNDPFAGVTSINGTAVQGGTFGWRTVGSSDPGGRFFQIPTNFGGVVLGNQFYTLLASSPDSETVPGDAENRVHAGFRNGAAFLSFLKTRTHATGRVSLYGYVKVAQEEGTLLFSRTVDEPIWIEINADSVKHVEYYGDEKYAGDRYSRVLLSF